MTETEFLKRFWNLLGSHRDYEAINDCLIIIYNELPLHPAIEAANNCPECNGTKYNKLGNVCTLCFGGKS